VAARDSVIPPVREIEIAPAGRALGGDVNPLPRNAGPDKRGHDRGGEIERGLAARMGTENRRIEFPRDLGPDREAAGLKTGSDRGSDRSRVDAALAQEPRGPLRDAGACPAPSAVEEGALRSVLGDQGDGGAVGRGDADPGVAGPDEESIGVGRRVRGLHDGGAVHLMIEDGSAVPGSRGSSKPRAILIHRFLAIPDASSQVERGVRPLAHPAEAGRHSKPRSAGEGARVRAPEADSFDVARRRHRRDIDRVRVGAQAFCAGAAALGLALAAGCGHVPVASSGSQARDRFLETYAGAESGTRGSGTLSYHRGDIGRSGLRARWGSAAESVAAVVYAGPVRAADATILGDSVYLALRPYELALGGRIPPEEGLGASGARFLVRPWSFAGVRSDLEAASTEPIRDGWRMTGEFRRPEGTHRFILDLDGHSNPRTLRIQGAHGGADQIVVRYGPMRKFDHGQAPRWIEWAHQDVRVRLDIEEHAPAKGGQFRHVPAPSSDWRFLSIGEPAGRDLLDRLLGGEGMEKSP